MAQLFVGLMAEGVTDYRFLKPIVEKTLIQIAYSCPGQIDITVFDIQYSKMGGFVEQVTDASRRGFNEFGIMILVIHTDADSSTPENAYNHKIIPAKNRINEFNEDTLCTHTAALIPVFETESWMLADKDFLRKQIGTKKTDALLEIDGHPESLSSPKEKIEKAIRIGRMDFPPKIQSKLKIEDLYSITGEAMELEKLSGYNSYQDFVENLKKELIQLNFLSM